MSMKSIIDTQNKHTTRSNSGKELALPEPITVSDEVFTDVQVLEVGEYEDPFRIDHKYAKHIQGKVADMILQGNPNIIEESKNGIVTKKVELSEQAENDFEGMFLDELLGRLADGSLKDRELSEASVVPEVFTDGWQDSGATYDISNDRLKAMAGLTSNLIKAMAVLEHVIPVDESGFTDDDKDHISGYVRMSATARSAATYIDAADDYLDKIDPEQADAEIRERVDVVADKAHEKWPKLNGYPAGVLPMRWL